MMYHRYMSIYTYVHTALPIRDAVNHKAEQFQWNSSRKVHVHVHIIINLGLRYWICPFGGALTDTHWYTYMYTSWYGSTATTIKGGDRRADPGILISMYSLGN